MVGETFESSIEELATRELTEIDGRLTVLESEVAVLRERRRNVRAVLGAIQPKDRKAPKKPKDQLKNGNAQFTMSQARIDDAIAYLRTRPGEEIKSRDFEDYFGWSNSYCSLAVRQLREMGVLRLARKEGSQMFYRSDLPATAPESKAEELI